LDGTDYWLAEDTEANGGGLSRNDIDVLAVSSSRAQLLVGEGDSVSASSSQRREGNNSVSGSSSTGGRSRARLRSDNANLSTINASFSGSTLDTIAIAIEEDVDLNSTDYWLAEDSEVNNRSLSSNSIDVLAVSSSRAQLLVGDRDGVSASSSQSREGNLTVSGSSSRSGS